MEVFFVSMYDEMDLRLDFEVDRVKLLAGRLLSLSGSRVMLLALNNDNVPDVWCCTGRLIPYFTFVSDVLSRAASCDSDKPFSQLVGSSESD